MWRRKDWRMPGLIQTLAVIAFVAVLDVPVVFSHGWLSEPPARSSMWLSRQFDTPKNYDHHALNCGGREHMTALGGKCGLCGDPYDGVRENEAGGKYATGIISRTYSQGEVIRIMVNLTQSHGGWFEFKLCANNDVHKAITQECLDKHVLARAGNPDVTRYSAIPFGDYGSPRAFEVVMDYQLPADLTCQQCVLQWKYITAHNPGYPYQEEFYGCSDIAIYPTTTTTTRTTTSAKVTTTATTTTTTTTTSPTTTTTPPTTTTSPTTTTTTSPTSPTTTTTTLPTTTTTSPTTTATTTMRPTPSTTTSNRTTSTRLPTPSGAPVSPTPETLSFAELYRRCRAKGVLSEVLTASCRELCSEPAGCLRTFCNGYCARLERARS